MITIISTTNRPDSYSLKIAKSYKHLLEKHGQESRIFSFESILVKAIEDHSFTNFSEEFQELIDEFIAPANKLIVIAPEYNGSYPGIFKYFIDACNPKSFLGKKVALVGIASGRAGNLRGMDHLTDVFHHMGSEVYSQKIPISGINNLMDEKHEILEDDSTIKVLNGQLEGFLKF